MQLSGNDESRSNEQTSISVDSANDSCLPAARVFSAVVMLAVLCFGSFLLLVDAPNALQRQSSLRFLQVSSEEMAIAEGDSMLATDGFIVSRFEAGFDATAHVPYVWVPGTGMRNTGEVTFHMYCEQSEKHAVSVSVALSGGSSASNSVCLALDSGSKQTLKAPQSYDEWATKTVTLQRSTAHAAAHILRVLGREDGTRMHKLTINNDALGTKCFFMQRPGGSFDLRPWRLQTDVANNAGSVVSYKWPEIGAHTSKSFYIDRSGALIFRASVNGATTAGSGYPRMELREMTSGSYDLKKTPAKWDYGASDWSFYEGTHVLKVRCAVLHLPNGKPQVIIGQIHGSKSGSEMIKLRATFMDGSIRLQPQVKVLDTEEFDVNNTVTFDQHSPVFRKQPLIGEAFDYTIKVKHGVLSTTVGDETIFHDYNVAPYKTPYMGPAHRRRRNKVDNSDDRYYFKVGAYCNAAYPRNAAKPLGDGYGVVDGDECAVAVHSIDLVHGE